MPSAVLPTISADDIDDMLYFARTNDIHDLKAGIEAISQVNRTSSDNIILATLDPDTGNGLLHMASANGCLGMYALTTRPKILLDSLLLYLDPIVLTSSIYATDVLRYLLPSSPSAPPPLNTNLSNTSGNTPLHWAAYNGHLDAVKILIAAGADPAIRNIAGHDAVYEAERNGKQEVVEWLLKETGVVGEHSGEEEKGEEEEIKIDNGDRDQDGAVDVQERLGNMNMEEKEG
ncbi:MAG: hypothetical protein Q9172_004079 [Xanthocarpia lactea]